MPAIFVRKKWQPFATLGGKAGRQKKTLDTRNTQQGTPDPRYFNGKVFNLGGDGGKEIAGVN